MRKHILYPCSDFSLFVSRSLIQRYAVTGGRVITDKAALGIMLALLSIFA